MSDKIESPSKLIELVGAFRTSRILLTAYELDLFSLFDEKALSSFQVSEQRGLNPRATDRLLNALVAIGVVEKKENLYSITAFAVNHLVRGKPGFMGGLSHQVHLWKTWSTLTDAVKAGTSVAVEKPINDRDPEWLDAFIAAMHVRGVPQAKETADLLDFSSVRRILDVGGGSGAFAFEFIRRCNGATAVVFDLPAVVPITARYIEKSGLDKEVTTLAGDYLSDDLGSGYDLIFVSAVIHINSPEENALLIQKCADALNPGGQLVILDHIMNESRTEPKAGAIFALNMLVGTFHGDTYTENEVAAWMSGSGLTRITRKDSVSGINLMIGLK